MVLGNPCKRVIWSPGGQTHRLRTNVLNPHGSPPCDPLPPTRLHSLRFHNLPKQCHPLGNKCSSMGVYWGYFTFKSQLINWETSMNSILGHTHHLFFMWKTLKWYICNNQGKLTVKCNPLSPALEASLDHIVRACLTQLKDEIHKKKSWNWIEY